MINIKSAVYFLFFFSFAYAGNIGVVPMRQVDRTILPPAKTWGSNQMGFFSYSYYYSYGHYDIDAYDFLTLLPLIIPLPPEYTNSKGWNFPVMIWPLYIRKAIIEDTIIENGTIKLIGNDLVIGGGLINIAYSQRDGIELSVIVNSAYKRLLSSYSWLTSSLEIGTQFSSGFNASLLIGYGGQFSDHLAVAMNIGTTISNSEYTDELLISYQLIPTLFININRYFGLEIEPQGSLSERGYVLNTYLRIKAFW